MDIDIIPQNKFSFRTKTPILKKKKKNAHPFRIERIYTTYRSIHKCICI